MTDLIIPMVFPADPAWQRDYLRYHPSVKKAAALNVRFRSWGTEELLLQCVRKYMPWVHTIHILLAGEGQVQQWMKGGNVHVVFHREFIPERYLPLFNVNTIEMHLHRIPGLAEQFIYSNDDFFPLSPLREDDFFRDGKPCQHHDEKPYPAKPNVFHQFVMSGLNMIAADFDREYSTTWLKGGHSMAPMLRSVVEGVYNRHIERINRSFTIQRNARNFNQYIFSFYQHLSGNYVDHAPRRQYVGPKTPTNVIASIIADPDAGIVCLNDNEEILDWERRAEIVRRSIMEKVGDDKRA